MIADDPFAPAQLPLIRAERSPGRTRIALGATVLAVFLATTFAISLLGGGVHESRAAAPAIPTVGSSLAPMMAPPPAVPVGLTPSLNHPSKVAQPTQPTPEVVESDVAPGEPRVAASATPIADPSTFGSEAYEPIYSK